LVLLDPEIVIDRETFVDVARRNPAMALWLVQLASHEAQRLMDLAESLALRTARVRVARLLYERALAEGVGSGRGVELARECFREEEVASRVGTVRVHVSRSLRSLARAGTIVLDRALIRIPNLAALERLAQGHADEASGIALSRALCHPPTRRVTFVTDI
jgi:CRP-like cAMP-binding protein